MPNLKFLIDLFFSIQEKKRKFSDSQRVQREQVASGDGEPEEASKGAAPKAQRVDTSSSPSFQIPVKPPHELDEDLVLLLEVSDSDTDGEGEFRELE